MRIRERQSPFISLNEYGLPVTRPRDRVIMAGSARRTIRFSRFVRRIWRTK